MLVDFGFGLMHARPCGFSPLTSCCSGTPLLQQISIKSDGARDFTRVSEGLEGV